MNNPTPCPRLEACAHDWRYVGVEPDGQLVCETECGLRYACGERFQSLSPQEQQWLRTDYPEQFQETRLARVNALRRFAGLPPVVAIPG